MRNLNKLLQYLSEMFGAMVCSAPAVGAPIASLVDVVLGHRYSQPSFAVQVARHIKISLQSTVLQPEDVALKGGALRLPVSACSASK